MAKPQHNCLFGSPAAHLKLSEQIKYITAEENEYNPRMANTQVKTTLLGRQVKESSNIPQKPLASTANCSIRLHVSKSHCL